MAKKTMKIVNSVMAILRSSGLVKGFRSMNGAAISPRMIHWGIVTPATCGWKYRRSSCRPRKYHGALDGFGVWLMFASSRKGALIHTETITRSSVAARIASISEAIRWGQVLTRSIGSFSTRWMASGLTTASRRWIRSGTPSPGPPTRSAPAAGAAAPTPAPTGTWAAVGAAGAGVPLEARILAALARAWATAGDDPLACSSASTRSKTASGDSPPLGDAAAAAGAGALAAAGAGASPPEGPEGPGAAGGPAAAGGFDKPLEARMRAALA